MTHLMDFYQSPIGCMTQDFISAQLKKILAVIRPDERVLILGYGIYFADDIQKLGSDKIILAYPDGMPPVLWPDSAAHQSCIVSLDALPFGDVTFDRVILVHALEFAPEPGHLLFEIQRILTAQGQLICITPNRNGIWSWFEHTPFGEGQTFSTRQIRRLLLGVQLSPLQIQTALFVPPLNFSFHKIARGFARGIEAAGSYLGLRMGGIVISVSQKQRCAGSPFKP
ncbi:MAG TPA: methyltransferase domain-containing protein, partial [Alphaproteobacteria bacterium]|nr:methyltransferase domain-containing protein [Alphaproteobacteria bacterium]